MRRVALIVAVVIVGCRSRTVTEAPSAVVSAEPPREVAVVVVADRDADGVADAVDKCPDEPEDADGFEDDEGCVDRDNDRDGVIDAFEWKDGRWTNCDYKLERDVLVDCRDRPEDLDGLEDADGCPDVITLECPRRFGTVYHDRRGAFTSEASAEFDAVAEAMREDPGIFKVYVDGHVERRDDKEVARRASSKVAERAVEELVARGVARERLEARGVGFALPIADERRPGGREANRRVQFELWNCGRPPVVANECV